MTLCTVLKIKSLPNFCISTEGNTFALCIHFTQPDELLRWSLERRFSITADIISSDLLPTISVHIHVFALHV